MSAVVGVWVGVLAVGCGGSEQDTGAAGEPAALLAVDDLRALVNVSPEATGWRWAVEPQTQFASPPLELNPAAAGHEIRRALTDTYQDAGIVRLATSSWWDNARAKKASSFANLFASAEDARTAMEAEREFAGKWFPEFEHNEI